MDLDYTYVTLKPTEQIGMHAQESFELSAVITGQGKRIIGDTTSQFKAGELVLVPPNMPHCWIFDSACTDKKGHIVNICLSFSHDFLDKIEICFPQTHKELSVFKNLDHALTFPKDAGDKIISLMKEMRSKDQTSRTLFAIEIILEITEALPNSKNAGQYQLTYSLDQRLKQVEIFVACNYARQIGIEDLAKHVGMNKSAFCAFFKRATGKTFVTYLNEYRLERALYLLKTDHKDNISQIAYACGFQTISHFNHLFLAHYGCSPRAFLNDHNQC